jgi:hypothetical protein
MADVGIDERIGAAFGAGMSPGGGHARGLYPKPGDVGHITVEGMDMEVKLGLITGEYFEKAFWRSA